VNAGTVLAVFGLIALAELPDKTMVATVVLGSRHRPVLVWAGASGAFLVHVCAAVAAGSLVALLPRRPLHAVVAAVFVLAGTILLAVPERRSERRGEKAAGPASEAEAAAQPATASGRDTWRVLGTAFVVVLVGELADLTQLLTIDLAARYHQPWSVGVGAFGALVAVSALGAFGGRALLRWLPLVWIRRAGGVALLGLAAYGIYALAA
jgi:putative Ca2+/H+ antiporter (TMEM165/GDT1 family)